MTDAVIALVCAFAGYLAGFLSSRGEILRLRQENADLLGSLYHRVGYKPSQKNTEAFPVVETERALHGDSFPDLLTMQENARNS